MSEHILLLNGVSAGYGGTQVLQEVSLEVTARSVVCLLGANGAGKTTTLRAISGLVWRRGTIQLDGQDISNASTEAIARLGVSHVPDGRGTLEKLSVEENLRVGGYTVSGGRARQQRIDWVFEVFGRLKERRHQQAGTLSGGEQQMLAIGRALMPSPKLLLLDEPSFGLAPLVVKELFGVLAQINAEAGMAILVVEQNAQLALQISEHAYVLQSGAISISGPSTQIAGTEEIQRAYLGAV